MLKIDRLLIKEDRKKAWISISMEIRSKNVDNRLDIDEKKSIFGFTQGSARV